MDLNIEKLITLAGNEHKYQYMVLIITFFVWINVNILPISLAFLEKQPEVNFRNPITNEYVENIQLNYTICEFGEKTYNVTQNFNYSWVIEYNITCDRFYTGFVGSSMFIGDMLGSLTLKLFADRIGRRWTTITGSIILVISLLSLTFCKNIIQIFITCVFGGFSSTLTALGSYLLLSEIASSRKRALFGSITNCAFSVCGIVYILLYQYLNSWRIVFYFAACLSFLFSLIYFKFLKESPRYYISRGNFEKFMESLEDIAKINNKLDLFKEEISSHKSEYRNIVEEIKNHLNLKNEICINDSSSNDIDNNVKKNTYVIDIDIDYDFDKNAKLVSNNKKREKYSIFDLIKYKSIRYKFLILCFLWLCVSGNYYGLTIFLKNLPGNIYFNGIMIYIFEAFSYFFAGFIVNVKFMGRKGTINIFYIIAIIGFSTLQIFKLSDGLTVTVTFISRFAVAGVFNILYTYSLEIYPTVVRALGFGINSFSARIAGVIFPILIELFVEYITIVFVIINVISFIFMLCMPETNGKHLIENFEENVTNVKSLI